VRTVSADLDISPRRAWILYSHPRAWPAWAPHMRGAWGLTNGAGEVKPNARGVVWLGLAPIPVKVTWVDEGRSWSWKVGPLEMDHIVEPREDGGCRVALTVRGPGLLEDVSAAIYGLPAQLFLRNMGRVGRRGPPSAPR
jgi:hypothetical protein